MANISFIDDNLVLGTCHIRRKYDELRDKILNHQVTMTEQIVDNGKIYGYAVTRNVSVSDIYQMDCYVVRFIFSDASTLHDEKQEQILLQLIKQLKEHMELNRGYYNLRIPTHIIDLLKAVNEVFTNVIFCGGTVEEIIHGKQVEVPNKIGLRIGFADAACLQLHKDRLMKMTYASFQSYQGQYHISQVTQDKAGVIYENWIRASMDMLGEEPIVVAWKEDIPVGFVTIKETSSAVEGILSAVDPKQRKLGAYKSMIAFIINYANAKRKSFVTSTQFDNFIVQGVWNSLGLKPFYSIYNIHVDNR